jgi:hypothetical protein
VALDGKTSRRSHDRKAGRGPLHLLSAFATNAKLVLGQQAVAEKANEIVAIPELVKEFNLEGVLVSIDAIACNPAIAQETWASSATSPSTSSARPRTSAQSSDAERSLPGAPNTCSICSK